VNPDEAYRLHTDWARAINRPGTGPAAWFERRIEDNFDRGPMTQGEFRRFGEAQTIDAMRRTGPIRGTAYVVGYERTNGASAGELPGDVYAQAAEPDTMSIETSDLLVPRHVYTPITVDALSSAPTYYVTRDMCTVIEAAAAAFDQFDLMPRMPVPTGFVVLSRPIELPMGDGAPQQVRAFAWNTWGTVTTSLGTPGRTGEVWTFSSRKRDGGMQIVADARESWPSRKAWQDDPDLLPCFTDLFVEGAPFPAITEPAAVAHARSRSREWFQTAYPIPRRNGEPVAPTAEEWEGQLAALRAREDQYLAEESEQFAGKSYGFWQPYLAAFVLLLTQQITVADKQPVSPSTARLGGQVSRTRPTDVTVVDVRHPKRSGEPGASGTRGPLTSRHLVGSHWKWQPYGEGRALRRRIFVSGYVRGPEDAPLVVKPRVTRLS
jgi:hypothetical protein